MSAPTPDHAVRWQAPDLMPRPAAPTRPAPSVAELEAIETAASEEGFRRGHADGYAAGMAQAADERRELGARVQALLESFARPLAQVDAEVQAVLAELAVQVAGALVGRAYAQEPALLAGLVQQALQLAVPTRREAEVRLHPDDLALVAPLLAEQEPLARFLADPSLGRGDLRVHTEAVRVDGSLYMRLQAALASLQATEVVP